ncbi:hypothetical protein HMPREF9519_02167 [Enterococcus faecalis TX1346]|nr:hypothetical protein HMPREF9519_02167 [Enterococcus faecalis TX1346]
MTFVPHIFFYIIWWLNWKRIFLFLSLCYDRQEKNTKGERRK